MVGPRSIERLDALVLGWYHLPPMDKKNCYRHEGYQQGLVMRKEQEAR
jgi:hypothetical protein